MVLDDLLGNAENEIFGRMITFNLDSNELGCGFTRENLEPLMNDRACQIGLPYTARSMNGNQG